MTALRNFETAYRTNLATHLRKQIESLESGRVEPIDAGRGTFSREQLKWDCWSAGRSISLSAKMLQASAEVVPATPHVSTLFWGTSAEPVAALISATGPLRRALWRCRTIVSEASGSIAHEPFSDDERLADATAEACERRESRAAGRRRSERRRFPL